VPAESFRTEGYSRAYPAETQDTEGGASRSCDQGVVDGAVWRGWRCSLEVVVEEDASSEGEGESDRVVCDVLRAVVCTSLIIGSIGCLVGDRTGYIADGNVSFGAGRTINDIVADAHPHDSACMTCQQLLLILSASHTHTFNFGKSSRSFSPR